MVYNNQWQCMCLHYCHVSVEYVSELAQTSIDLVKEISEG